MSEEADFFDDDVVQDSQGGSRFGAGTIRQALARWWLMLLFGAVGYAGALYYMSITEPSVTAMTVLEVNLKERMLIGADLEEDTSQLDTMMMTVTSKMLTPKMLAEVANTAEVQALKKVIPPDFSLKPRYMRSEEEIAYQPASAVDSQKLVGMIAQWVEITPRVGTSLIDVEVTHPDGESARVIADSILNVFLEGEESEKSGGVNLAFQTLKEEAEDARANLESAQKSLQVYEAALKLDEQLRTQRAELIQLKQRYKSKHPKMVQFMAVYQDLNKRFRREIERASSVDTEQTFWLSYREQMSDLDEKIGANEDDAREDALDEWLSIAQNALSTRASLLKSRVEQEDGRYGTVSKRMLEIGVGGEEELEDYRVMQAAFIGNAQDAMRMQHLAIGSGLGILIGFGVAYLLGVIDFKIYDVRSVEEVTGLTCMAAIPSSKLFDSRKEWMSVLERESNSPEAESIRNLRASVTLLGRKENNQVILVTSAIPGEGKTSIAAELASALALAHEKTLLIDFDLRKPRLSALFPIIKGKDGIVDVLAGLKPLEEVIHREVQTGLDLIGPGNKATNPAELLKAEYLEDLLNTLRPQYERIIIDSAPVIPVSDTRMLARFADGVIVIAKSRKAPIGAVLRTLHLLKESKATLAGVVLNSMKKSAGRSYMGYKGYGEYGANDKYNYYAE